MGKGDKHTFVGQFFEEVGHSILGGDLSRNDDGDISLWRTRTCVEVKSSSYKSSYGFRLSVEQIHKYEQLSLFPFDRAWYMLFSYRNNRKRTDDGKRVTELSVYNNPLSINNYLAKSILWCTIVDLTIVKRWKETLPHSTKSVMGNLGLKTVNLKAKDVHDFSNGKFSEGLCKLGLDPLDYDRLSGQIDSVVQPNLFSHHEIKLPVTAILPRADISSFQRMLKRRGFRFQKVA